MLSLDPYFLLWFNKYLLSVSNVWTQYKRDQALTSWSFSLFFVLFYCWNRFPGGMKTCQGSHSPVEMQSWLFWLEVQPPGPHLSLLWAPAMSHFPWPDVLHFQMASSFRDPTPSFFMEIHSHEWLWWKNLHETVMRDVASAMAPSVVLAFCQRE